MMSDRGIDMSRLPSNILQRTESVAFLGENEEISRLKTKNTILEKKCEALLI